MRKPSYQHPRSTSTSFSLARKLPKLRLSSAPPLSTRAKPRIGKPGRSAPATLSRKLTK